MNVEFELFKERRLVGAEYEGKWVTTYKNEMYVLYLVEDGEETYVNLKMNKTIPISMNTDGVNIACTGTLNMAQLKEFIQDLAFAQATYEQIKQQFSVQRIKFFSTQK